MGRGQGGLGSAVVLSDVILSTAYLAPRRPTLPPLPKVTLRNPRWRRSYPLPSFSTALIAAAEQRRTLIPSTIDLILIGVVANISIAGLFAAGVVPAVINALGLIAYAWLCLLASGAMAGEGAPSIGRKWRSRS